MIVRYSPEIFDENPSKKPFGFVVVKPTRIFSAIVERQLPKKSYLIEELDRIFTPISILKYKESAMNYQNVIVRNDNRAIGKYKPSAQMGPLNALQRQSQV